MFHSRTSNFSLATLSISALVVLNDVFPLAAQESPTSRGKVTVLSGGDAARDLRAQGAARLIQKSLSEQIDALVNRDLKRFAQAHHDGVEATIVLADVLSDSAEALGQGQVTVALAEKALESLPGHVGSTTPSLSETDRALLRGRVEKMRAAIVAQIRLARQQYEAASDEQRKPLLVELHSLVRRAESLDTMGRLAEGGPKMIGTATTQTLARKVEEAKQRLAHEAEQLALHGDLVRQAVIDAQEDLAASLATLQVASHLPTQELERLYAGKAQVNQAIRDLASARQAAEDSFSHILAEGDAGPMPVEADVLSRVDRFLQRPAAAAPQE